MEQKLYPPYIEGTIPAFYKNNDGTATMVVPFSMNKTVSKSSIGGFYIKLKTVQNSSYLLSLKTSNYDVDDEFTATFTIPSTEVEKLNIGQYYKIQLAYESKNGMVGYYSTVGIIKFTTKPSVFIDGLSKGNINTHQYSYTGRYEQADYKYEQVDMEITSNGKTYNIYEPSTYYEEVKDNIFILCTDEYYNSNKVYYVKSLIVDLNSDKYKDSTEKEYSYQFVIYDKNNNITQDSGWLLHDSSADLNSYESNDSFLFSEDLELNYSYYIQYNVITNNGLECSSPKYRILQRQSIDPEIEAKLKVSLNRDNGYMNIQLNGELDEYNTEILASGTFLLSRSSEDDNYKLWHELYRFALYDQFPSKWIFKDFTIEQGKKYRYSLQQYNDTGLYSSRIYSDIVKSDFEDAFLYDGERQLKIKYNPKISSFKITHLETKTDTIGSKYPFIFRNGNVEYKEFPISGLISYNMDEEQLFMTNQELSLNSTLDNAKRNGTLQDFKNVDEVKDYINDILYGSYNNNSYGLIESALSGKLLSLYNEQENQKEIYDANEMRSTDLSANNILAERKFKLNVLDWLNNGQPKLFRSPGEGNYIVRLMNVSLSPEDRLSRMLHSFSCTAYEIAEYNYNNLNNFSIIAINEPRRSQLRVASVQLSTTEDMSNDSRYEQNGSVWSIRANTSLLTHTPAFSVRFVDMLPGTIISITQKNETTSQKIVIGATGSYFLDENVEIMDIQIDNKSQGIITYSYYDTTQNLFNKISNIDTIDNISNQNFGSDIITITNVMTSNELNKLKQLDYVSSITSEEIDVPDYSSVTYNSTNLLDGLKNLKDNVLNFLYLDFMLRPISRCYYANGSYYKDKGHYNVLSDYEKNDEENWKNYLNKVLSKDQSLDPFALYRYDNDGLREGEFSIINNNYIVDIVNNEKEFIFYFDPKKSTNIIVDSNSKKDYIDFLNKIKTSLENLLNNFGPNSSNGIEKKSEFSYNISDTIILTIASNNDSKIEYKYNEENKQFTVSNRSNQMSLYYIIYQVKSKVEKELKNTLDEYDSSFYLDGNKVDLEGINRYFINTPYNFKNIKIGNGVVVNYGYQLQEIHYITETKNIEVENALNDYNIAKEKLTADNLEALLNNNATTFEEDAITIQAWRDDALTKYKIFIKILEEKQAAWEASEV